MCKEMPVIPVNRVVDKKIIMGKNGGGEAQGSLSRKSTRQWSGFHEYGIT
jgi:hypothetical protein